LNLLPAPRCAARFWPVIEYTYEWDGQIVVPARAKAVGRIQEADRSGYVAFIESLMMPDGATVPIQAVATDLENATRLKGKVEGKNTGKNVWSGRCQRIGEAGALLLGRGSFASP